MVSGTPTTAGSYAVGATVTGANSSSGSYSVTVVISSTGGQSLTISPGTLGNLTTGAAVTPVTVTSTPATTGPYNWSLTAGSLPAGLLLSNGTTTSTSSISSTTNSISVTGTPTTAGPYSFTMSVTDSASPMGFGSQVFSGTVGPPLTAACTAHPTQRGNESALAAGTPFAFILKGWDANGNPITWGGSFTSNGSGGITAADVDYVGFANGAQSLPVQVASSSYSFDTKGQGCLYLVFNAGVPESNVQAAARSASNAPDLVEGMRHKRLNAQGEVLASPANATFSFSLGQGTTTGLMSEFDYASSKNSAAGQIHQQTASSFALSSLSANFAFGVDGWQNTDANGDLARAAIAGSFANATGALSNGAADYNLGGLPSGPLSGGSGALNDNVSTTTGRGTGTYTISSSNGALTFNFAYYIINGSDFFILSTDNPATEGNLLLNGRAIQSAVTTQLPNGYYLLAFSGIDFSKDENGNNIVNVGTVQANNLSKIPTATIYTNDAGYYSSSTYSNLTYAINQSSGRVLLTGVGAAPPIVYLTGTATEDAIVGFLVGTDLYASSGIAAFQATIIDGANYSASSITGAYSFGTSEDVSGQKGSQTGVYEFDGMATFASVFDLVTIGEGSNQPNQVSSGTYTVNADGSGNFGFGNPAFVTNGSLMLGIDTNKNNIQPQLYIFAEQATAN
jgi:hypothetical protein